MGRRPFKCVNSFSAGIDFIRQILTSVDVWFWRIKTKDIRFWRIKTLLALKGLIFRVFFCEGHKCFNCFRARTVFIRQNMTSIDVWFWRMKTKYVRFWRIKTVPALKGLISRVFFWEGHFIGCAVFSVYSDVHAPEKPKHRTCASLMLAQRPRRWAIIINPSQAEYHVMWLGFVFCER